ncbi:MAG TPA: helix-turn-helix domain-containing protein [Ktedonobacterales bacterium]|jgi:AcrR family transcriptional regulator|nr:helix-turn-helix domain-containing protein [Ktedonobacterales bacterium]
MNEREPDAPQKRRREEYAEATRRALLDAARTLFTAEGYQETNIEAIARAARVTRGAFYYYFADKKALFDAVVVVLQAEAAQAVARRAVAISQPWEQLQVGIEAYLDACLEPAYRRLVIQEAPAILGTARARAIDEVYTLALLTASLRALRQAGELDCEDVDLLSHMLGAMICEVALLLPGAESPAQLREHARAVIGRVLTAFRRV